MLGLFSPSVSLPNCKPDHAPFRVTEVSYFDVHGKGRNIISSTCKPLLALLLSRELSFDGPAHMADTGSKKDELGAPS